LKQIDDPPAHNPVNRRNWAAFQSCRQRRSMRVVQPRRLSQRIAVDQTVRSARVELQHLVADDLQRHTADLLRLGAPRPS
jgi:hypothetical protein